MNTKERLIKFLEYLRISQGKFETSIGLSNGFVNNVGDNIRRSSIDKITSVYPELNTSWLLTGVGEMLKEDDLISRIKKVMYYYDLNTTQFAEKTGIGQANLSSMLNGNRVIGEGVINKIIISFDNISKDWLLTGQGNMIKNNYSQNIKDENVASENNSLYGVTRIVEPDNQTVPYFLYKDQLDENKRLTKEIARLELLLEQHGINPTKQIS